MLRPVLALVCVLSAFAPLIASAKGAVIDYWPYHGVVAQKMPIVLGTGRRANYVAIVWHEDLSTPENTTQRFQPFFELYRANAAGKRQGPAVYRSPSRDDPLKLVPKMQPIPNARGVWMPGYVDVRLIGSAQLMQPGESQLVLRVYSSAADCGAATLHVLTLGSRREVLHDVVQVQNYCALEANLQPHSVALTGPYYDRNAALCCPTKNRATALLRYDRKRESWVIAPQYFRLSKTGPR